LLLDAQREFFARSLATGAATRPAATTPAVPTSQPNFENPFLLPPPASAPASP
jgi:hypothetical protein